MTVDSTKRAARERRHFDRIAIQYENPWYRNEIAIRNTRRRLAFLRGSLALEPGMHVLEVGCGTGYYTQPMLANGVTIYGIDISPAMLKVATWRSGSRGEHSSGRERGFFHSERLRCEVADRPGQRRGGI